MKTYYYLLFLCSFVSNINAQSLQRETIASSGAYVIGNGTLIRQTIGQPYGTSSNYDNGIKFNPGFQQALFSVETINSTIDLLIFPNPATRQVTIKTTSVLENVNLQIIDANGKILISEKLNEFTSYTANCDTWANGVYLISLYNSKNNLYSSKLIINK